MMFDKPKLLHLAFSNGANITLNPNCILFAMPDQQNLMATIIAYGGGVSGNVGMPYTKFIRLWQAAIEGRDVIEGGTQ